MSKSGRHGALRTAVRTVLSLAALSVSTAALSQQAGQSAAGGELEEVVVTGFRGSLNQALDVKRAQVGAVDAIVAEDIADCIAWCATRPHHVNIDRMVVRPLAQAAQHKVHRVL